MRHHKINKHTVSHIYIYKMYTHTLANTHRSSDTHFKDHHLILPLWGSPRGYLRLLPLE